MHSLAFFILLVTLLRNTQSQNSPFPFQFHRDSSVAHIDCSRLLIGKDCEYGREIGAKRVWKWGNEEASMDCVSIRNRVIRYAQYPVIKNPIAFAKIVNEHYLFLEEQLSFTYHPLHSFCFSVDAKMRNEKFGKNIEQLAKCIPNVYLTPESFNFSSSGTYMNHGFHSCWKLLLKNTKWKYVLDMQNHDIIMKTAVELSEIVDSLNGSNAIQISPCNRCGGAREGWYINGLEMKKNETFFPPNSMMQFASGLVQNFVSRDAIDYMINEINLDGYLKHFTTEMYGMDELFLATLQNTETLGIPGGMTSRCLSEGHETQKIVRYSNWDCSGHHCSSGNSRHCICVMGIEDLPTIARYPNIIANKMLPQVDYSAISCVGEMLYNRTYGFSPFQFQRNLYSQLTHTRYRTFISSGGNSSEFNCSSQINPILMKEWESNWYEKRVEEKGNQSSPDHNTCYWGFSPSTLPHEFPSITYYTYKLNNENLLIIDENGFSSYEFLMTMLFLGILFTLFYRQCTTNSKSRKWWNKRVRNRRDSDSHTYHSLRLLIEESSEEEGYDIMNE